MVFDALSGFQPQWRPQKVKNVTTGEVYDGLLAAATAAGTNMGRMAQHILMKSEVGGAKWEWENPHWWQDAQ
eukprot:g61787.t1